MSWLASLDALFITNPTNIRYLTGFVGVSPEEREVFVLFTRNQVFLFTNALYREAARKLSNNQIIQLSNNPIEFIEISREYPISKRLAQLVRKLKIKKLGFEEKDLTVAEYRKLKKELKNVTLIPTKDRIERLRMIKGDREIKNIKAAAKLTDQCFNVILSKLKMGVTEREIGWEIEAYIRKKGAELAFSPIVAFGKNTSQAHYNRLSPHPKENQSLALKSGVLQDRDLVLLDFGAKVNGYCADMTRVVFIGKPQDEWRRVYQTVLEAQAQVLAALPKTRSGAKLDRLARNVIKRAGFLPYPHSLGHNVGLAIHEDPRLTMKKDPSTSSGQVLLPGMVITVEPAIYKEGQYGIRIEDLVLLKKDRLEVLSTSSKELIIL